MAERMQAIKAARLVDGTGAPPIEDAVLLITDDRISKVGRSADTQIPAAATVVDLGGATLLPGLIDAHVHFYRADSDSFVIRSIEPPQRKLIRAVVDAQTLLQAGFTGAREMGNRDSVFLKQAIEAGEIAGPRLVTPRMMIVQTGGSPDPYWLPVKWVEEYDYRCRLADGVDEVRKAAREQIRGGADFVKIMASGGLTTRQSPRETYHYSLKELEAIVEEGHKVGLLVAAHAIGAAAVKNAARAGVDTIEHGGALDEEALDLMAERDILFIATLGINHNLANASPGTGVAPRVIALAQQGLEDNSRSVARARERGIRIAAGTDFGGIPLTRHGNNAIEAELLVRAGLTPAEAIVAITKRGAEAMGRQDEMGTLEVGKYADLSACETNPLDDVRALQQVGFVMKGGQIIQSGLVADAKV